MALSFTPGIIVNADGSESPDFDGGYIENSVGREAASAYEQDHEFSDYYGNEVDGYRHRFADLDPSIYERYEEDYAEQIYSKDMFDGRMTNADEQYLLDIVGGSEASKQALLEWGEDNLNQQDWSEFLDAMDGDIEQMAEWINWLNEVALDQGFDASYFSYDDEYEQEEEYDEYDEYQQATEAFVSSALEHYGQDSYLAATHWAYNNLPDHMISQYDQMMDHPDFNLRAQMVNQLMSLYYSSQQDDYEDEAPVPGNAYNYF
jgi:hypothetical protein